MRSYVSYITIVGVMALVFSGGYGYYEWNKEHKDEASKCPESQWTAQAFFDAYNDDFKDKVIGVSGVVSKVEPSYIMIDSKIVVYWKKGMEMQVSVGEEVSVRLVRDCRGCEQELKGFEGFKEVVLDGGRSMLPLKDCEQPSCIIEDFLTFLGLSGG